MNPMIPGQILPDSVILWLMVACMGMALWGFAAPRPVPSIIRDAVKRARHHLNVRMHP